MDLCHSGTHSALAQIKLFDESNTFQVSLDSNVIGIPDATLTRLNAKLAETANLKYLFFFIIDSSLVSEISLTVEMD